MKLNHKSIIPYKNKSQELTKENIAEIKSDIELFQKSNIRADELVAKLKIIISQFNTSTRTFELSCHTEVLSLPFLNAQENLEFQYLKVMKDEPKKQHIIQPKRHFDFQFREKIEDYDKEVIAFGNIIFNLFCFLSNDRVLKNLIVEASKIPAFKKELENIEIYKNIRFSDFRCSGTILDKLNEYYIDLTTISHAAAKDFEGRQMEGKDKAILKRLKRIVRRVARKQREMHLLKARKIGETGEAYCSSELLAYQKERDIEQQEFIDNTEIVYSADGVEQKIPLAQFALTDERKASEIYMKVKDLQKVAMLRGYIALFTTFTCPAEFHSNPANGRNCWSGLTPRDSSDWLSARLVALNKDRERHSIQTLGMWCKEVHKDQCVHMHSMFFVRPDQADDLISLIHKHYSHSENAVKIVRISEEEAKKSGKEYASPASYITKYIIKSLREKSDESMKNKAVSRLWGFRMYGFFGKTQTILWRAFDRFFDKEPNELFSILKSKVFVRLATLRQAGQFWAFCEYANAFIKPIIVEHDEVSWSGFEFIRKVRWGYRVQDTDDCLRTKFDCSLKTSFR
ncbi:replication endonuclease [Pseudomonas amygdali]|nr:replication endonuclease [Pseudomonas amygdali]